MSRHRARILIVSDGVVAGAREDRSGPALTTAFRTAGFEIERTEHVADGIEAVADALRVLSRGFTGVVATTGGTGFGPRDLTPEGTRRVLDREAPGLAEAMRLVNPLGRLSRGIAGTIGTAIVLNLPGSSTGAVECLEAVIDVLPHALELIRGEQPH